MAETVLTDIKKNIDYDIFLILKPILIKFALSFLFSKAKYPIWPNYRTVRLGYSKLLGKLTVK